MAVQAASGASASVGAGATTLAAVASGTAGLSVTMQVLVVAAAVATWTSGTVLGRVYSNNKALEQEQNNARHQKFIDAINKLTFDDYGDVLFPSKTASAGDTNYGNPDNGWAEQAGVDYPQPVSEQDMVGGHGSVGSSTEESVVAGPAPTSAFAEENLAEEIPDSPNQQDPTTTRTETRIPPTNPPAPSATVTHALSSRLFFQMSPIQGSDSSFPGIETAFGASCTAFFVENTPSYLENVICRTVSKKILASPTKRPFQAKQHTFAAIAEITADAKTGATEAQDLGTMLVSEVEADLLDFMFALKASDAFVMKTVFDVVTSVKVCILEAPACQEAASEFFLLHSASAQPSLSPISLWNDVPTRVPIGMQTSLSISLQFQVFPIRGSGSLQGNINGAFNAACAAYFHRGNNVALKNVRCKLVTKDILLQPFGRKLVDELGLQGTFVITGLPIESDEMDCSTLAAKMNNDSSFIIEKLQREPVFADSNTLVIECPTNGDATLEPRKQPSSSPMSLLSTSLPMVTNNGPVKDPAPVPALALSQSCLDSAGYQFMMSYEYDAGTAEYIYSYTIDDDNRDLQHALSHWNIHFGMHHWTIIRVLIGSKLLNTFSLTFACHFIL